MSIKPQNDPITSPEDSRPTAVRKQRAGRNIVTFFVIYALGAFSLYIFIVLYGALTSN
ncbi:hypothetical protein MUU53_13260 [Rhizobium lemnae]|uniref:Uncharacterized protein n=1 Tax=Rhizobium lemnae TaxID=1214924 RepID=A0ABV8EFD8_9HYPH|nr:hypothetical protein [Rhizobium lemnae]MCJ8508878.1 hypothetical protein [Rhizobium lemnae]